MDWEKKRTEAWRKAVDAAPWEKWMHGDDQQGWTKTLECPVCHHEMHAWQEGVIAMKAVTLNVECDCTGDETGRPSGVTEGCGAYGEIQAKVEL